MERLKRGLVQKIRPVFYISVAAGISFPGVREPINSSIAVGSSTPNIGSRFDEVEEYGHNSLLFRHSREFGPEAFSTQVQPKERSLWCNTCYPTEISIPKINFSENVQDSIYIPEENYWSVPTSGVATSPKPVENNIVIFGHSRWNGINQPFGQIIQLEAGDLILVKNQFSTETTFQVSEFRLGQFGSHTVSYPKG